MIQVVLLFILGLSVGSFLNVLIDRLPKDESILGRSRCDHCKHMLSWYDLVPLLSFVLLNQKCRYCGKRLSAQYPIIELITGILFVITYLLVSKNNQLLIGRPLGDYQLTIIYHLFIISGLITIFVTDLKYRIIPDQVLGFLFLSTFIFILFSQAVDFSGHLVSAIGAFILFLSLTLFTKGYGMGLGDVKFAFVIGFILGFPLTIVALYLSFLTGAVISLILVVRGRKTIKSTIPFGPFLAAGTFVSLFYGEKLWEIFKGIIGI